jgi:DNA-binding NtrC family response regulator
MVLGESGTGKEVVAREIHRLSGRSGALTAINCAAIPAPLIESELFGYKRGAFSGADRDKLGLVRAANGGTLFLDEIGDMPAEVQVKLLRVLETREVYPVGATQGEKIDVRVICATHRDLKRLENEGRFRGDLFARLNDYRVLLPPLRERKEDLYLLARHMLGRHGRPALRLSFPFMTALCHYDWPYNVRELESSIKRAIALVDGPELDAPHLTEAIREQMASYGSPASATPSFPPAFSPAPYSPPGPPPPFAPAGLPPAAAPHAPPYPLRTPSPAQERRTAPNEDQLRSMLDRHRGNVAAVGRELGKERMQIHRWLKRYGIDLNDYRD